MTDAPATTNRIIDTDTPTPVSSPDRGKDKVASAQASDAPDRRPWARGLVEWTLALAPTFLLIGYWLTADRIGRITMLEDDAYYYLGVARSLAEGQGSTFAGTITTNGYHPLWLVLLVPVTWVVQEAEMLVLALLLVHGALWAGSVREAFKIGDTVTTWHVSAAAVAAYSLLAVMTGHLAFNGMESALVMYLFLVLIRVGVTTGTGPGIADDLKVGVLLALICLARLDAVFGAVPVAVALLLTGGPRGRDLVRRTVAFAAPPALALGVYIVINLVVFGTPTPVSGQMKALGAPGDNTHQIDGFLQAGKIAGQPLWLGTAGMILVGLALLTRPWRRPAPRGRLTAMAVALVVGEVLLVAYLVTSTAFMRTFPWYHYQVALFTFGSVIVVGAWLNERVGSPMRVAFVGIAALFVVGVTAEVIVKSFEAKRGAAIEAADWVDDNLPPDAVVAMGDRAGYFGYLADRPLLHLEGLVADADYLHEVQEGGALDRIRAEGVGYYVNNARPPSTVDIDGRGCFRFVEPPYTFGPTFEVTVCEEDLLFLAGDDETGKGLTIWRYHPELNQ